MQIKTAVIVLIVLAIIGAFLGRGMAKMLREEEEKQNAVLVEALR